MGKEHRDGGQGRGDHRAPHLRGASDGRCIDAVPLLAAAEDRLEDDDRRVDQHADTESETAQGHHVEGHAEQIEWREGHHQRHRNRHADDQRRPQVAEEEEQHDDRQQATEDRRLDDFADAALDEERPVGRDRQLDLLLAKQPRHETLRLAPACGTPTWGARLRLLLLWLVRIELAQLVPDPLGQGDDVGVGLLEEVDLDALARVGAGEDLALLVATPDLAEVADPDLAPFERGDDGVADLLEVLVLVERADHVLGPPLGERAAGEVDVLLGEAVDHLLDRDPGAPQLLLVEQDVDLLLETAADSHRGDSLDRLESPLDLQIGQPAKAAEPFFALEALAATRQRQFHHRVERRVEAQDERPLRLFGQQDQVELLERVLNRIRHRRVPGELEDHVADSGTGDARDPAQTADDAERLLDRAADVVLHFFGRRSGVLRPHRQGGVGELRHQRHRKAAVGEEAEDDRGDEHHGDRHRAAGHEAGRCPQWPR